ncbi:MAG: phosphoglycerate dehydrogenase [Cytophagales bacterium]|tara:strand:- start:238 stop:1464 length:1227 start_codon:yes stop_codon:yes gene_type:complete
MKKLSFPKSKIKVLLLEKLDKSAKDLFEKEGYDVETHDGSLSEDNLIDKIKKVSILGIRSKTHISKKVIKSSNRLLSIGAFCIGTNQINLNACAKAGITVFNAPYSNTRSVVEIVIGQIINLLRSVIEKSNDLHDGIWRKDSINSYEIRNKTIGIIGYGNIGSQLSVICESLGMKVIYYDIVDKLSIGNAKKHDSLDSILKESDIVSLHVDGREDNTNLIGEREINLMKEKSILINYSRGNIVNINALKENLLNNKLMGAAIDVFPKEPLNNSEKFESSLRGIQNLILSPHIGGSTKEAQKNIGSYVPDKIIDFINTGNTSSCVNFPDLSLPEQKESHRLIHIHNNEPGVLLEINKIISSFNINIKGQYLKTNEDIGYVITDIDREYNSDVVNKLKNISQTIKLRVLY